MSNDDRQDLPERKSAVRPVGRNYPVDRPAPGRTDKRFSNGLMFDLLAVLRTHGYPELTGLDIDEFFHTRVFRFLYGDTPLDFETNIYRSEAAILADLDESRPANPLPVFDRNGCPVPQRNPDYGRPDPLRRFERLQNLPEPEALVHAIRYHGGHARTACGLSLFASVYANNDGSVTCPACRKANDRD